MSGADLLYDVARVRADFPILAEEVYGKPLVYLDNGASSQKPESVLHAFADHGEVKPDITGRYDEARKVIADLAELGVEYDDVVDTLEREGVEKFEVSWQELLDGVRKSLEAAAKGKGSPNKAAKGNAKGAEKAGGA